MASSLFLRGAEPFELLDEFAPSWMRRVMSPVNRAELNFFDPYWVLRGKSQFQAPSTLACDVKETDSAYELTFDVPGVCKDDIIVRLGDEPNTIEVSTERFETEEESSGDFHVRECIYGSQSRTLRLPEVADLKAITAKFEHGVLRVKVGKRSSSEEQTSQNIPIE